MLKKLLQSLLIIATSLLICVVHAQSDDNNENKRKIYDQLVQSIQALEEKAQYSGDDPIIRERLGLPPKLHSFEDWVTQAEQLVKKESASAALEQHKNISENTQPIQTEIKENLQITDRQIAVKTPAFPFSQNETYAVGMVYLILLLVNFIFYSTLPSMRKITIAPPFDIGVKGDKTEAENKVKVKRYTVEFSLLVISIFVLYFIFSTGKSSENEDMILAGKLSVINFSLVYVCYLIARFIFGFSSKCPKCKTPFAAKLLSEYDEPKSTFQKKVNDTMRDMDVYEVGIHISEFSCRSCNHSWKKNKNYKKIIDKAYV
jgi:hypothetical protein